MSGVDLSALNDAQRKIATTLDAPLFVEAGAGSGKTFTLTRRIVWALSPGSGQDGKPFLDSLSQVLVITFTNAAAQEIRERVRSSLRDAGMRDAALAVDSAWIGTIHGMCRRILKRNALDLGLDPEFEVVSDHVANTLLDEAVEQVVGAARREEDEGPLSRAFEAFGYPGVVSRVLGILAASHAALDGFDSLTFPSGDGVEEAMARLTRMFEAMGSRKLSAAARKAVDASLVSLRAFEELAPGERSAQRADEALAPCKLPAFSKVIADLHAEAKEELAHARALVPLARTREFVPVLVDLARRTDEAYESLKRDRCVLDNDDLVTLALKAVRSSKTVASRYAGQFRLVMVDEFQDTDTKQLELISILAGREEGSAHAGEEPEHLATVGDAQQSIYRFRGADVGVFNARGERIGAEGHIRLDVNYRSHGDILAFVEAVCGGSHGVLDGFMHLDDCPTRHDGYVATSLPRVSVEIASGVTRSSYATRETTEQVANQIAKRLVAYRDAGESPGGMALLLGTTTHAGCYLDAMRARGLECVVTGGSTFAKAPEVDVMLSLLRTLANPRDTQSGLFPVLSSEMFDLDANDFLQLGTRRQEKLPAPTKRTIDRGMESLELFGDAVPSVRLRRAYEVLQHALAAVSTRPVADVCLDMLRDSGWLSRLEEAGPEGRAKEANLLASVRYIRDLTDELGLGPSRAASEFARWLSVSKEPPASLAGAEQNMVRVMTIHASKGLEYPVVAVAECWNNPKAEHGVLVGRSTDGTASLVVMPGGGERGGKGLSLDGIVVDGRPDDLAEWAAYLKERNRIDDDQEKARLLYVALTRAREALVMGLVLPHTKKGISLRLADGVANALFGCSLPATGEGSLNYGGTSPAYVRHVDVDEGEGSQSDESEEALGAVALADIPDAGHPVALYPDECAWVDEVVLRRSREGVFSYSSALANKVQTSGGPAQEAGGGMAKGPLPTRAQREAEAEGEPSFDDADKATSLGSAFHALAQTMVESGQEPSAARIDALCRRWRVSARQRVRLERALEMWSGSKLRQETLSWEVRRAEVPFFADVSNSPYARFGTFVEGAIDLLCTHSVACEGEALVVDYKTGDLGLDEGEVRTRHAEQAKLYATVLLMQGFDHVTCAFICVETGLVVRYEFG